jgi:hypothetical protein
MTNSHENLRAAIQAFINAENTDGWLLNHYVVVIGVQKMDSAGKVNSGSWMTFPEDQAEYITAGLLDSAANMQSASEDIEDEG